MKINQWNPLHWHKKENIHFKISVDATSAFDKLQYPLVTKTYRKLKIEGTILNLIKDFYRKCHTRKKYWRPFPGIRVRDTSVPLSYFYWPFTSGPKQYNEARERNKSVQNWKLEKKKLLLLDNLTLYLKSHPKSITYCINKRIYQGHWIQSQCIQTSCISVHQPWTNRKKTLNILLTLE